MSHISKDTASWTFGEEVLLEMSGQQRLEASLRFVFLQTMPKEGSPDNTSIEESRQTKRWDNLAPHSLDWIGLVRRLRFVCVASCVQQ